MATAAIDITARNSLPGSPERIRPMSDVVTTGSRVRVLPPGPPEGVVSMTRRVSDLGLGAASLGVGAVLGAVDRFRAAGPADRRREPTLLHELAHAATGVAMVTEQRALDVAEAMEVTAQRAIEIGSRVPIVRDVIVGFGSFVGRWSTRADVEQARRRAETTDFFARLIPAVVDAVIERVDVAAVVRRIPLAEIVGAVDVEALLDQIDVNTVLARVDVDAVVARVDADGLMERVDVEAVVARVDANALVQRVDADALVRRVDANALVQRVDVAALLDRVDLTSIVAEVLDEVDIGAIVRESTGSITNDAVDGARVTAMRLDGFVGRIADRLLLRGTSDRSGLPPSRPPSHEGRGT